MSKDMLGAAIRAAVGVPQNRLEALAKIASAMATDNPNGGEWHSRFLGVLKEDLASPASGLLDPVATIEVGEVASFIANDKFREGKTTDGVSIAWLGSNFENNFLGKTEKDIAPATLRIQKLKKDSLDVPIIAELGDTAETTLTQLWELMKLQGSGQKGSLLVNGYANIFYIRDKNDVLWAVRARWRAGHGGWGVGAFSVEDPGRWDADLQVVSR